MRQTITKLLSAARDLLARASKKRSSWLLLEQFSTTGSNFVAGACIAKICSPNEFGLFVALLSNVAFFSSAHTAMSIGVTAVDVERLKVSKKSYHTDAIFSSLKLMPLTLLPAIFCLAAILLRSQTSISALLLFALPYTISSIFYDVLRRLLCVSDAEAPRVALTSMLRAIITAFPLIYFASTSAHMGTSAKVYSLTILTLASVLSLCALASVAWGLAGRTDRRTSKIALARQTRRGSWFYASSVANGALDQTLLLATSTHGSSDAVGGWRAGSYIFGVMNPALQIADLMAPRIVKRFLQRDPSFKSILLYLARIVLVVAPISLGIATFNSKIWLAFLGHHYTQYWMVSYIYGVTFFFTSIQVALSPLIRTSVPSAALTSRIIGTGCGLALFFAASRLTAEFISLSGAFASLISCAVLLFYLSKKSVRREIRI